jgi:hypothetical protein
VAKDLKAGEWVTGNGKGAWGKGRLGRVEEKVGLTATVKILLAGHDGFRCQRFLARDMDRATPTEEELTCWMLLELGR